MGELATVLELPQRLKRRCCECKQAAFSVSGNADPYCTLFREFVDDTVAQDCGEYERA